MAAKKFYFYCAYGHVMRIAPKMGTPEEAAQYCFGVTSGVTVYCVGSRNPKYATYTQKMEWENKLRSEHHQKTGSLI